VRHGGGSGPGFWDCISSSGSTTDRCDLALPLPGIYYVMVRGFSAYSGVTLSATAGGPPAAPSVLRGAATSTTSILVGWRDGSPNETSFTLARRQQSAGAWGAWVTVSTRPANTVEYPNSGLAAGATYQYRLRACNEAGCSAWVNGSAVTTPTTAGALPAAPTGVAGTIAAPTQIRVGWTDASANETSFTVSRRMNSGSGWGAWTDIASAAANANTYLNSGLTGGPLNQYQYRVRACNAAGCSAWVLGGVVNLPALPAVPTDPATTILSPTRIHFTWTDASTNERTFTVARRVYAAGAWSAWTDLRTVSAGVTGYTDTGLTGGGQLYSYRVRACNAAGCSTWATAPSRRLP